MPSDEQERRRRAATRSARIVRVAPGTDDASRAMTPVERISLCTELSRWAHQLSGRAFPSYPRSEIPCVRRELRRP